jgi:DNA-binding CsgD family transcriptional regulator
MAIFERHGSSGLDLVALESVVPGDRIVIGKAADCDLVIDDDDAVSRVHAKLERVGPVWTVTDLGSTNGTVVNGKLLAATYTLRHGDEVLLGRTRLLFRDRASLPGVATTKLSPPPRLTRTEREVLVELCRAAFEGGSGFQPPASVAEIAERRFTSISAVRQVLEHLYDKFGIIEGPNRRVRLANAAILCGAVTSADMKDSPPTS